MANLAFIEQSRNNNWFAESRTHGSGATVVAVRGRDLYLNEIFHQQDYLSLDNRSFGLRRKLVTGTVLAAGLGACAFAYGFLSGSTGNTLLTAAEVSPPAQSSPANTVELAANTSGPSPISVSAAAHPESSSSITPAQSAVTVGVSQKVTATPFPTESRQSVPGRNRDVLFLQRPTVKIRSAPSTSGTVVGTAPKGTRFEVTNREGDWVQVERGRLKGWISAQFLAPTAPR